MEQEWSWGSIRIKKIDYCVSFSRRERGRPDPFCAKAWLVVLVIVEWVCKCLFKYFSWTSALVHLLICFSSFVIKMWCLCFSMISLCLGWPGIGSNQAKENAGAKGSTRRGSYCILCYFVCLCRISLSRSIVTYLFIYRVVIKVLNSRKLRRKLKGGLSLLSKLRLLLIKAFIDFIWISDFI